VRRDVARGENQPLPGYTIGSGQTDQERNDIAISVRILLGGCEKSGLGTVMIEIAEVFSYHSCGNRSCPKCHTAQTQEWLEHRQAELLPVPYFHITITVPAELRAVLRANQRDGYSVLMQACAAAIIELARDPRYVGGTVAVLAVLHTWTQHLNLHSRPQYPEPGQYGC
jgi:Transposase zinc-binding domain